MSYQTNGIILCMILTPLLSWASQAQVVTLKQVASGPVGNASLLKEEGVITEGELGAAIIVDQEKWQYWHQKLNGGTLPLPPLPLVNFGESFLLFIGLAPQSSGGHALIPDFKAELFQGMLTIKATRRSPPQGQMAIAVVTVPYFVVQVPRQGIKRVRLEWDEKSLEIAVKP